MLKSNPSYLRIAGKNPALGPPKSALGLGQIFEDLEHDFFQNSSDRGWISYQNLVSLSDVIYVWPLRQLTITLFTQPDFQPSSLVFVERGRERSNPIVTLSAEEGIPSGLRTDVKC